MPEGQDTNTKRRNMNQFTAEYYAKRADSTLTLARSAVNFAADSYEVVATTLCPATKRGALRAVKRRRIIAHELACTALKHAAAASEISECGNVHTCSAAASAAQACECAARAATYCAAALTKAQPEQQKAD
jgi:hypothetical protein